jgi:two-component system aerobic respiration control sensor histidine kinase ArcB
VTGENGGGRDGEDADEFPPDDHFVEQVLAVAEGRGFVTDVAGRLQAWNDRFAATTARDAGALAGLAVGDLFLADEREAVVDGVERALETGEATAVAALETPDGPVTHDLRLTALTAPDGSTVGVVGVANPLSPGTHVAVDDDLEFPRRTHLLEQIFEEIPVALYVKDREGRHLLMSAEHASRAGATGKTDPEYFDDALSRDTLADDRRVAETGEPMYNVEEYNIDQDAWVLTSKVPWYDEDGDVGGVLGVTRHITEKKQYERALERENERLERLASVISHDLRNPLNVARGQFELLAEEVDSERIETADDALDRMETIIDDVLTLARQGKTVDDPERVTLSTVAREAWTTTATGDATLDVGADTRFLADRSRLVELFGNLFRNAVEHTAGALDGEDVTVRVGTIDGGFFLEDDGPGIPEDERDRIFEAGFTTATEGTGFGLAIVQEVATAHGWTVSVTEGTDGGARFEVTGVEVVE